MSLCSSQLQLNPPRPCLVGLVIGPPLAYALAMGFSFTVMYLSAAVAFIVCGVMVWFFYRQCAKMRRWQPARWKHRVVIAAIRCCCLSSVR